MPDWRWTNFPVPEAHLILGAAGVGLGLLWPFQLGWEGPWLMYLGLALAVLGVGLIIWATASAGTVVLADPNELVTTGPYATSRHPMYVGWTLAYLALICILDSAWLLILFPVLALWINSESAREEQRMVEKFGSRYIEYQARVRRYL